MDETISKCDIFAGNDLQFMKIKLTLSHRFGLPFIPTFSIWLCAFIFHRWQYVIDHDGLGMIF